MALGQIGAAAALLILSLIFIMDSWGFFKRKNYFPVNGRTALITGGSQGMGEALAQLLSSRGANVVIVSRSVAKLEQALIGIKKAAKDPSKQRFHHISADLTDSNEAKRVIAEASTWNNNIPPPFIFNCAGASQPGYFLNTPVETHKSQMDTNYFSSLYIAHAACHAWLSQPSSSPSSLPNHLVFTSSLIAFLPMIGYNTYAPSKTALRSLASGLSQELKLYTSTQTPIRIATVFPGTILTPGYEAENITKPAITKKLEESETDDAQTADKVAAATLRGLERGEEEIIVNGILGRAMRAGMLGAAKREGACLGFVDWALGLVVGLVLVFTRRDFDKQVRTFGRVKAMGGEGGLVGEKMPKQMIGNSINVKGTNGNK